MPLKLTKEEQKRLDAIDSDRALLCIHAPQPKEKKQA